MPSARRADEPGRGTQHRHSRIPGGRQRRPLMRTARARPSGHHGALGNPLRRRRQHRRDPGGDPRAEPRGAADLRDLLQPQLRQGDRHRGRPRQCPRRGGGDHGCRSAAPAGGHRDLRRALAGGLRHGLRPAHRPARRELGQARVLAAVLPHVRQLRRDDAAGAPCPNGPASRKGSMPGSASARSASPSSSSSASSAPASGASASCSASPSTA